MALRDQRIVGLHHAFERRRPRLMGADEGWQRAAVALLVRPTPADLEILFIERPTSRNDPWSGHMAFPGGRRSGAEDDLSTAVRETAEEVGLDLDRGAMQIGRLDDIHPSRGGPQIAVAAFVFAVPADSTLRPSPVEVAKALWIPLGHLSDPSCAAEHLHILADGAPLHFPAIAYHGHVIWGLTYRMLMQFLEVARAADAESSL